MPPLPSSLQQIARIAADEGAAVLRNMKSSTGAAQAVQALEAFRARLDRLSESWAGGRMDAGTVAHALESERDTLTFTLAAIVNENKRQWLAELMHATLSFALRLFTTH